MSEIKHSFVRTNGINMHVAETGEGFPVVFCHGFPELWYSWRHQMKALAEAGFRAIAPDQRGYGETGGPEPIEAYMAKADPAKGQQVAKVCLQCHTFAKGEPNKIGPNLWDIMEENIATVSGYQFSPALLADKDKKWTRDELNIWLYKPQEFAHGTKMTFPGLPKPQDRADVIAYLESLK